MQRMKLLDLRTYFVIRNPELTYAVGGHCSSWPQNSQNSTNLQPFDVFVVSYHIFVHIRSASLLIRIIYALIANHQQICTKGSFSRSKTVCRHRNNWEHSFLRHSSLNSDYHTQMSFVLLALALSRELWIINRSLRPCPRCFALNAGTDALVPGLTWFTEKWWTEQIFY